MNLLIDDFSATATLMVIGLAALVTYSLRIGGLLLSEKLPKAERFKKFMDALPGTILLSLIAPRIAAAGFWGGVAVLCTGLCSYFTRNIFLAMLVGVGIVALARHTGL
jgi:uncharacterized membrane protein